MKKVMLNIGISDNWLRRLILIVYMVLFLILGVVSLTIVLGNPQLLLEGASPSEWLRQLIVSLQAKEDHVGDAIVYGDTDSVYFSAWPMMREDVEAGRQEWTKEIVAQLYDGIADQVNLEFPVFMERAFHCPRANGEIIQRWQRDCCN
jgi:hypothetical protein